jgi:hypothetical protein
MAKKMNPRLVLLLLIVAYYLLPLYVLIYPLPQIISLILPGLFEPPGNNGLLPNSVGGVYLFLAFAFYYMFPIPLTIPTALTIFTYWRVVDKKQNPAEIKIKNDLPKVQ